MWHTSKTLILYTYTEYFLVQTLFIYQINLPTHNLFIALSYFDDFKINYEIYHVSVASEKKSWKLGKKVTEGNEAHAPEVWEKNILVLCILGSSETKRLEIKYDFWKRIFFKPVWSTSHFPKRLIPSKNRKTLISDVLIFQYV